MSKLGKDIKTALAESYPAEKFIPSRYPFTYAYDFFRQHPHAFGATGLLSRSEAAGLVTQYAETYALDRGSVVVALADAYLAKNKINISWEHREDLINRAETIYWKSMGSSNPNA